MSRCVQTPSINVREEINPGDMWQLNYSVPSQAAFGTEESAATFDSHVWGDRVREWELLPGRASHLRKPL